MPYQKKSQPNALPTFFVDRMSYRKNNFQLNALPKKNKFRPNALLNFVSIECPTERKKNRLNAPPKQLSSVCPTSTVQHLTPVTVLFEGFIQPLHTTSFIIMFWVSLLTNNHIKQELVRLFHSLIFNHIFLDKIIFIFYIRL